MVRVPPLVGPLGAVVGAVVGAEVAAAVVGAAVAGAVVGAAVGAVVGGAAVSVGKLTAVGAGATVEVGGTAGAAQAPRNTLAIITCDRITNNLLCFMVLSLLVQDKGVEAGCEQRFRSIDTS